MRKKKLTLHRETLRRLSGQHLRAVVGASYAISDCGTCHVTECESDSPTQCFPDTLFCPNTTQFGQTVCQACEM